MRGYLAVGRVFARLALPRRAGRRYTDRPVPNDATLTTVLIFAAFGVAVGFLALARKLRRKPLPYYAKEHLLSKGELAFYRVLARAVPQGLGISMKTRLSDVIGCTAEGWKAGWGAKISQKHVDFVVFDPVTSAIILVIELDDRTHDLPDRRARDVFVDDALAAAGVAILRVPAARAYDLDDLREQVEHLLRYAANA
jgi:hypothetical protein